MCKLESNLLPMWHHTYTHIYWTKSLNTILNLNTQVNNYLIDWAPVRHGNSLITYVNNFTPNTAQIGNHTPGEKWEEINYQFPNFSGCAVESMLGLKLNHVSKGGPWCLHCHCIVRFPVHYGASVSTKTIDSLINFNKHCFQWLSMNLSVKLSDDE